MVKTFFTGTGIIGDFDRMSGFLFVTSKNKILTIFQLCKLMEELIAATVVIGDRSYRIKVRTG